MENVIAFNTDNIVITTVWMEGYETVEGNTVLLADDVIEEQLKYNVKFVASPTEYRGLHRGLYVDVSGEKEDVQRWWSECYNGLVDGKTYHDRQFENRLSNSKTPWGSINFTCDE
jgi:hypothetical protein